MNVLLDNLALFREGFLGTLSLTAVSALLAAPRFSVIPGEESR